MMIILLFLVMLACVIISMGYGALYIAPGDVVKNPHADDDAGKHD